jgi:GDPmannose 4,6-dehydratase
MMQQDVASDFVIATGETRPLAEFVHEAFAAVGLDWREHVDSNPGLMRPTDLRVSRADTTKAADVLGWKAATRMAEVARKMVTAARQDPTLEQGHEPRAMA